MKFNKKRFAFAGLAAASLLALASCNTKESHDPSDPNYKVDETIPEGYTSLINKNQNGEIDSQGYYTVAGQKIKTKNVYKAAYATEVSKDKLNYLCNTWTYNSEVYTNMIDGMVENDKYGNIVGAVAKAYKVETLSNGKQKWTFKLREGVQWVKNDTGEKYADVKAQDFVDGLEYVLNPLAGSGSTTIVTGVIDGAEEYYQSKADEDATNDLAFSTVGIKALDDYTVEYTTIEPTPYFMSNLTYSPFLPVNGEFLAEKGTDFGNTENDILVNGAFRLTEHVNENKQVFTKNNAYWDKKHVYVDTIERTFMSSAVATNSTTREWYESGKIDGFTVRPKDVEGYAKYVTGEDGKGTLENPSRGDCNGVLTTGDATYGGYFNFARVNYDYTGNTAKTEAERQNAQKAIKNANFRKGLLYGLNMLEYLPLYAAEPIQRLARSYTTRELCSFNNKDYVDYVDDVYNKKNGTTGVSLSGVINKSDPIYNPEKALQFFQTAKTELIAAGLTEAAFPIKIDVLGAMDADTIFYETKLWDSINKTNGIKDIVQINVLTPNSDDQEIKWMNQDNNYDLSLLTGWGPDYADPKTFLGTFVIGGDLTEQMGLTEETDALKALSKEILGEYDAKAKKAFAEVNDINKRYELMAEAEYSLIYDYALFIPWYTASGYSPSVSKVVPYTTGKASYGLTSDKLKDIVVSETAITKEIRAAIKAAYDAAK